MARAYYAMTRPHSGRAGHTWSRKPPSSETSTGGPRAGRPAIWPGVTTCESDRDTDDGSGDASPARPRLVGLSGQSRLAKLSSQKVDR